MDTFLDLPGQTSKPRDHGLLGVHNVLGPQALLADVSGNGAEVFD